MLASYAAEIGRLPGEPVSVDEEWSRIACRGVLDLLSHRPFPERLESVLLAAVWPVADAVREGAAESLQLFHCRAALCRRREWGAARGGELQRHASGIAVLALRWAVEDALREVAEDAAA